jgi:hypothetical protein
LLPKGKLKTFIVSFPFFVSADAEAPKFEQSKMLWTRKKERKTFSFHSQENNYLQLKLLGHHIERDSESEVLFSSQPLRLNGIFLFSL